MIKPEVDLELSIKALEVYNIEPNIIKSMLTNLQKLVKQNCNIPDVSKQRELLKAFSKYLGEKHDIYNTAWVIDEFIKSL